MPQPTWKLNGVWSYLLELYDTRPPRSAFILSSPLLFFLARSMERGKLGTPRASAIFGARRMGKGEVEKYNRGAFRVFRYQRSERNDGRSVRKGESTPTSSQSSTDLVGRFNIGYANYREPFSLWKADLDACTSANDVRMQVEFAYDETITAQVKRIHRHLWSGGMGAAASVTDGSAYDMNDYDMQQESPWAEILGLEYIVGTQNNIYGMKDRATETALNPFAVDATDSGFSDSALAKLKMIDRLNTGFTKANGDKFDGLAFRNPNGIGVDLVITTPDIFDVLRDDAASTRSDIYDGRDVPDAPMSGFKYPVIKHGRTFIAPDPLAPAGKMFCISTENAIFETSPDGNYDIQKLVKKWEVEEGGEEKVWGSSVAKPRFAIDNPAMCGVITNVATS